MSLYLGSEKVENVTAQITLPVDPSDDLPLANGTASAGVSKKFSRADHVHPKQEIPVKSVNNKTGVVQLTASDVSAIPSTLTGTAGQILTKTANGQEWKDLPIDENNVLLKNLDVIMPTNTAWRSVCYGDGKFVAVAGDYNFTTDTAAYSTDGIKWTQTTLPASTVWYSVCYGNGKFVAVAWNSSIAAYSTDGINWNQAAMPVSEKWYSVCYGNDKFVAVAYNSSVAAYSTDGVNWTQVTLPASAYWRSVCYGNDKFVAVAGDSSIAAYSTNGINWSQTSMPASRRWTSVCYGNSKFIAVDSNIAAYSTDGINWSQATLSESLYEPSICYGNGKFVAVTGGNNATSTIAIYSTDGINWTQTTLPAKVFWLSVCYGNDKFIAVAKYSELFAYSTDGINWSSTTKALQYPDGTDIHEQVKEALNLEKEKTILLTKTDIDSMSYEDFKFLIHQFSIGYAIYYYEPTDYILYGQSLLRATNYDDSCLYFSSLTRKYDNDMNSSTNLNIRDSNGKVLLRTDYEEPIPYLKYITLKNTPDGCKVSGGGMLIDQLVTIDLLNTTNTLLLPTARKITLSISGWSNNQQTVTCTGVSSKATNQEIRVMPADANKTSAYVSCGVSCVAQAADSLTFACDKVPTTAIDVYVVMQSLNFQN